MKVLIISSSPRKGSNSDTLADEFIRGAVEAGHDTEKILLREKKIKFCNGCLSCTRTNTADAFNNGESSKICPIKDDDVPEIIQKIHDSDIICWATPIYFYEMSGQMKTLIDRCNPLYTSEYHFRDIYLLCTATDKNLETPQHAIDGLKGWISCFEKARLKGYVFAGGVSNVNDITGHSSLQEAYKMGKSLKNEKSKD